MIHKEKPDVIAILDWELSTLGDPCADFSYHCMQYRLNPLLADENYCKEKGIPTEKEYVSMYVEIINYNTFQNLEAELKYTNWRKC